jgi:hypothetical protein
MKASPIAPAARAFNLSRWIPSESRMASRMANQARPSMAVVSGTPIEGSFGSSRPVHPE